MDRHVLSFLGSAAAEVNELRQLVDEAEDGPSSEVAFRASVVQSLGERLSSFSKAVEKMQTERHQRSIDPLRLLSDQPAHGYGQKTATGTGTGTGSGMELRKDPAASSSSTSESSSSGSFSQRFVDEVAPPSRMREYHDIAQRRRRALLQESALMHARFGLEFLEVSAAAAAAHTYMQTYIKFTNTFTYIYTFTHI